MSQGSNGFTTEQIESLRTALQNRKKIEEPLSRFTFDDQKRYSQNIADFVKYLQKLVSLEKTLQNSFFNDFEQYLGNEDNIAIEINFSPLRYEQLLSLFQEWSRDLNESSFLRVSDRLYSVEHRNILFNRVFVEQRTNIEEYFETISPKKMMRGVDLYNLLQDILSQYYLYEYASDNEVFFDKVNSYNSFLQLVEKFKHSEDRINIDNKSKDFDYIKIYEFEGLIHYWQKINPQLELRSDVRFSIRHYSVQTQQSLNSKVAKQQETQTLTEKERELSLEEAVNSSIRQMNKLTESEEDPEKLEIIQRICEMLRKEKITLGQLKRSTKNESKNIRESSVPVIVVREPETSPVKKQQSRFTNQVIPEELLNRQETLIESQQSEKTQRIITNSGRKKGETFQERSKRLYSQLEQGPSLSSKRKEKTEPAYNHEEEVERMSRPGKYERNNATDQSQKSEISSRFGSKSNRFERSSRSKKHSNEYRKYQGSFERYKNRTNERKSEQEDSFDEHNTSCPQWHYSQREPQRGNEQLSDEEQEIELSLHTRIFHLLEIIYSSYSKETGHLNIERLNDFFIDIGIIDSNDTSLVFNLIKGKVISNLNRIKKSEFLEIMDMIMEEDEGLNFKVLEEFIELYIFKSDAPIEHLSSNRSKSKEKKYVPNKFRYTSNEDNRIRSSLYPDPLKKNESSYTKTKARVPLLNFGKKEERYQRHY